MYNLKTGFLHRTMGIIVSNAYLAAFGAGTVAGAITAYFILMGWRRLPPKEQTWENEIDERLEIEPTSDEFQLVVGVKDFLNLRKGQVAVQCGHAAVAAYAKAAQLSPKALNSWLKHGGTKIVVCVNSERDFLGLELKSKEMNVLVSVVRLKHPGESLLFPGAKTVIAIGPAPKSVLDQITGYLKRY